MKKSNYLLTLLLSGIVLISSCSKDPEEKTPEIPSQELFKKGIYLVNEGGFGNGDASIDLFVKDSNKLIRNIFQIVNDRPLGDVAQSLNIFGDKGYIVLNGSGKVEVIYTSNAKSAGTITGFASPRYMTAADTNTAYVSDWFSNTVKVVNLQTKVVNESIPVGTGPEGLCILNNRLYVANSGGYDLDSTISVINTDTKQEITKITVGDAPVAIHSDINGKLWVLCKGASSFPVPENESMAKLVRINPANNTIEATILIGTLGDHPDRMTSNGNKNAFYILGSYGSNGVYKFNITDNTFATSPIVSGSFYGVGFDKVNNELYVADAVDYVQNGIMNRYNQTGTFVDSMRVGKIPNGIQIQ